jgi:hypothetical protein
VHNARDDAIPLQLAELLGQHLLGDAINRALEVGKATDLFSCVLAASSRDVCSMSMPGVDTQRLIEHLLLTQASLMSARLRQSTT